MFTKEERKRNTKDIMLNHKEKKMKNINTDCKQKIENFRRLVAFLYVKPLKCCL